LSGDQKSFARDTNFGRVEYVAAQPFSGMSKLVAKLTCPEDAAILFGSEADVGQKNGRLFVRKLRERLNSSKDSRATIVVDIPRSATRSVFNDAEMATLMSKHGLLDAGYDGCCVGSRSAGPVRTGSGKAGSCPERSWSGILLQDRRTIVTNNPVIRDRFHGFMCPGGNDHGGPKQCPGKVVPQMADAYLDSFASLLEQRRRVQRKLPRGDAAADAVVDSLLAAAAKAKAGAAPVSLSQNCELH